MRWKLILFSSLTTAFLVSIVTIALRSLLNWYGNSFSYLYLSILGITSTLTAVFVFQNTEKNRFLQTILTLILSAVLGVVILISILYLFFEVLDLK
jgi:uncharacterized membrane protein YeaQ/YmgE (transglycosylase-associated protein family)